MKRFLVLFMIFLLPLSAQAWKGDGGGGGGGTWGSITGTVSAQTDLMNVINPGTEKISLTDGIPVTGGDSINVSAETTLANPAGGKQLFEFVKTDTTVTTPKTVKLVMAFVPKATRADSLIVYARQNIARCDSALFDLRLLKAVGDTLITLTPTCTVVDSLYRFAGVVSAAYVANMQYFLELTVTVGGTKKVKIGDIFLKKNED